MDGSMVVSPPYLAGPLRLGPFQALQLDPSRVGDPASARLYARPYRGVATRVKTWIERGDIIQDSAPALYLHEYADDELTVRGIVGALDLRHRTSDRRLATVLPHEGVHPAQARELARRMREMRLNPAPILLTQRASADARDLIRAIRQELPTRQYLDRGRQRHRIWAIRDLDVVQALNTAWASTRALVADGHHRYAAYLENQSASTGGPAERGLAMLVDEGDTPLRLGAIHRVLVNTSFAAIRSAAGDRGYPLVDTDRPSAIAALARNTIAVSDGRRWANITLPSDPRISAVEQVDGTLVPQLSKPPRQIHYEHSIEAALTRTRHARAVIVVLPALTIDQVWQTVDAGHLLPEKATSFQPKPHSGVFIRSLLDAQPVH